MKSGNKNNIKLSQLRALVAVADYGNFSEAALQLSLTQAAISHAIASLEKELGVILFHRGRYGANLTPVGQSLLKHARQMETLANTIAEEANIAKGLEGGKLRLASLRSIATHLLPTAISNFGRCFPNVSISIVQYFHDADVLKSIREGSADIGFVELPLPNDFETYTMMEDKYVVLLPPSATFEGRHLSWEQLRQYPLILPFTGYSGYASLREHLVTSGVCVSAAYEINEDSIMVGMVAQNLGAAILPKLAALPIPQEIRVYDLPTPLTRTLGAATITDRVYPPPVFAFLEKGLNGADVVELLR